MFLSIIIPAFNEAERLPKTLEKVRQYLLRQDYDYEVIIVDDGSTDETYAQATALIKSWAGFQVLSYEPNRGKGHAVKTGMLAAYGDWRLLMDADNSTDISEIEKFWNFANSKYEIVNTKQIINSNVLNSKRLGNNDLDNSDLCRNFDIIIGSRYLDKDSIKIKQPILRRVVSRLGNLLVRLMLGIKATDTQCGFKLFSRASAEAVFAHQTIERWGFDMEILAIGRKRGYPIKEVAVDWYDAEGSKVKKGAAMRTLKELLQIKWKMVWGKYK